MGVNTVTIKSPRRSDGISISNLNKEDERPLEDGNYTENKISEIESLNHPNQLQKTNDNVDVFDFIKRSHGIYNRDDINIFSKRYRFGLNNPYESVSTTREFLFITKPDLNIFSRDNISGALTGEVNEVLSSIPYWRELIEKHIDVIRQLQMSIDGKRDPFNHLLENMCISNLSVPGLDAETIETPNNMYGVGFSYRGSSEASNDNFDFDLEFKDTKYLPVYQFFKAYEEYQTLKHHGSVGPWRGYIQDKVLHDQFSIYKFVVDEDLETIIYYCKYYGVMPKSLPRDVFSSTSFDSGLSYSSSFKCAFFEDMNPLILNDFNTLTNRLCSTLPYEVSTYNEIMARTDNRPVRSAYVKSFKSNFAPGGSVYKLIWRGSDKY